MIEVRWTERALSDLGRLHGFLAVVNITAADRLMTALTSAPERLIDHPRLGERITGFAEREVRRIFVSRCEMRYEIQRDRLYVLRVWHGREVRSGDDGDDGDDMQ